MVLIDHGIKTEGAASISGALLRSFYRETNRAVANQGIPRGVRDAAGTADWSTELHCGTEVAGSGYQFYNALTGPWSTAIIFAVGTSDTNPDLEMAQLEMAAESSDKAAFSHVEAIIDWHARPAEDYVCAIQLALSIGAHASAHRLTGKGYERYPQDPTLRRMAQILILPRATRVGQQADPTLQANRDWFTKHSAEYHGQWVAVRIGQLLGHAESLALLAEKVPNWREVTVTRIAW